MPDTLIVGFALFIVKLVALELAPFQLPSALAATVAVTV